MIYQNDPLLAPWINHYMCAVNCVASYREFRMGDPWDVHEFGALCHDGVRFKAISGDLNGDGDMDDPGESTIQDWQRLADFMELPLRYKGKFPLADLPKYDNLAHWVLTPWRWQKTHWVVGSARPVLWDPWKGGSATVKNGAPIGTITVFEVKK